ncbi:hypothetical protein CHUAL_003578 [Chamberlinius hualienensis]
MDENLSIQEQLNENISLLFEYSDYEYSTNFTVIERNNWPISYPVRIAFGIIYVLIFVMGLAGNPLIVYHLYRHETLRTAINIAIGNLALGCVLQYLFSLTFTLLTFLMNSWNFGTFLCGLYVFLDIGAFYIIILNLLYVSIEHYFNIIHPQKPQTKFQTSIGICIGIWIFSMAVSIPGGVCASVIDGGHQLLCVVQYPQSFTVYNHANNATQLIVPLLIVYCFARTWFHLWRKSTATPVAEASSRNNRKLTMIVFVILLLYTPNYLVVLDSYTNFSYDHDFLELWYLILRTITYLVVCVTPLLFTWYNNYSWKHIYPCFGGQISSNRSTVTDNIKMNENVV